VPSLSEAFYTGITGRSSIVGNPDLEPEKSLNIDAGLKIHHKNIFLGAYLFQYSIRDMIEKFPLSDTAYTYENIERGRIRGLELEFQFQPTKKLEIFGNGFYYRGISTASGITSMMFPAPSCSWERNTGSAASGVKWTGWHRRPSPTRGRRKPAFPPTR